jgi:eukaryotic-like serine/threonine-protein kinase
MVLLLQLPCVGSQASHLRTIVFDAERSLDVTTTRGQHLIGQEIGSCILETPLGYGGSSGVFLAQNRSTNEKVAVKVFLPRSNMDRQTQRNFYQRFLREAEAVSELDHPNILSIYSYGEHNGLPYIIMPYMPGGTLSEYVAKYGPLSLSEAQKYIEQISSALDYAHENGRVHCDVKPANLLLDGWGHVVLSDFGIVRLMQPEGESAQQSTKSPETLMGTPDYISPEQALGEALDGRSDVYSFAVTLFFLLAGSPPFKSESSIALALMHVHDTPPALGTMRADITPQIDRVIGKALSKWPEERYQTAGEFSAAFTDAVANAQNYVFSDSDATRRAIGSSSAAKQALAAFKPVVQVKSAWKHSTTLRRIILPFVLLLAVIIGSVASLIVINSFTSAHSQEQTALSGTQTDYLADKQSKWPQSPTYFFQNKQYHIKNKSLTSIATAFYGTGSDQFTNFSLTVTASEIHGSQDGGDFYGIIFRSSADQAHYYLFEITAWDRGQYEFLQYDGQAKQKNWNTIESGTLSSLSPNLGQLNLITVVANGNSFNFLVNNKPVGKPVIDNSGNAFTSGEIGLCVEEQNTEVVFSHLHIKKP